MNSRQERLLQESDQRFAYIGFCRQCGGWVTAQYDDPNARHYTQREVQAMTERGLSVERHCLPTHGGPHFVRCVCCSAEAVREMVAG